MEKKVLLRAKGLYKQYGSGDGATIALNDVSFEIYEGELLVILGSSGSGKSTLLNIIGGMDRPTRGSIYSGNEDICTFRDRKLTNYRKNTIGFVFQSFNLIQELTAQENVALTADTASNPNIVKEVFEIVGLSEKMKKYPAQLSGGEQQRVSIARALAKNAAFLLCDEPTGALDYETGKQVLIKLESLSRDLGQTIVIVTHTKEIAKMADRVIRMRSGKIIEEIINTEPVRAESIEW